MSLCIHCDFKSAIFTLDGNSIPYSFNSVHAVTKVCNEVAHLIIAHVVIYPGIFNFFLTSGVEVQFSGATMIQHYLGYKNLDCTFAPAFQDKLQLPTYRVANCDAIGENSSTGRIGVCKTGKYCTY